MKTRWIVATALVAGALLAGAGFGMARQNRAGGSDARDMMAMHGSRAMQAIHGQMPAELRERCSAMHAQMDQVMEQMGGMMSGGMMGGTGSEGMMSGSGMADHAGHHGSAGGDSR